MSVTAVPETRFFLKNVATGVETEIARDMPVGREGDGLRPTREGSSRTHARLTLSGGLLFVEDRSSHGTFIADERLPKGQRRPLLNGARVKFYSEEFVFRVDTPNAEATRLIMPPPAPPALPVLSSPEPDREAVAGGDLNLPPAFVLDDDNPATQRLTPQQREAARKLVEDRLRVVREASGVDSPHLRFIEQGKNGREILLQAGDRSKAAWTVGRMEGLDIVLDTPGVSSMQAVLNYDGGKWTVADQTSSNGTWVNGKRVTRAALKNGDFVSFGTVECVFRLPGGKSVPPPSPVSPADPPQRVITARKPEDAKVAVISFVVAIVFAVTYALFA